MNRFAHNTNARTTRSGGTLSCLAGALLCAAPAWADETAAAGEPGGPGLAVLTKKALLAELEGTQFIDDAVILIRDGRIERVGAQDTTAVPEGYESLDLGDQWVMPGMVDLHSHVGGNTRDYNDMIYQCNPGLRVSTAVVPNHSGLQRAIAAGVTTILFIPGSGTNIGGQGVLMKTAIETYEGAVLRNPGSLKIAQGDNPTRWGYRMGHLLMNFHLRDVIERGMAYATRWEAFEANGGEKPKTDLQFEVFRDLKAHRTQVSTHTQYYQLVMMSIQMLAVDYGLDVFIDHGSFDSYLNTDRAIEHNVAAILGPREVMFSRPPRFDTDGQVHGAAWGFQQRGHTRIGFNTDATVVPQESLSLQAAMGVRYGMDDRNMEGVRGLTIIPSITAGIADRVGSIEAGKDADLLVVTGDPCDPRTAVECVMIEGRVVYDTASERRRW